MRLAILTNAPAPYRVPIFEALAAEEDVELRVFFDDASHSTTRADASAFPHEFLRPGWGVRARIYQDRDRVPERRLLRFGWRYLPRLAAFRPDVVISGELGWRTVHAAAYAALRDVPLCVWWEGTPFTERHAGPVRTAIRRLLAGRAAGLVGFGSGSVACLEAIAPPGTPVRYAPQAVDNDDIARQVDDFRKDRRAMRESLGLRGRVLLCVGRLHPPKGTSELLAAMRRLHARSEDGAFTLVLAGDGPQRAEAERLGRELGGAVRVLGSVPPEEISRWLAVSDALLFPTLRDCWGMVVNEALAAGVPVLGSRYAGACEELVEDPVGLRFDPLDAEDFDRALDAVVMHDRLGGVSVERLRRAVVHHTCERAAAALLDAARAALTTRALEARP